MFALVTGVQTCAPPISFQPHVAQRRLRAVTRLILTAPDINANHAPRQQTLRGTREHQAMAAADIEYTLIAAPWQRRQYLVTQTNLADLAAPQHHARRDHEGPAHTAQRTRDAKDRKSTRLNSSHE